MDRPATGHRHLPDRARVQPLRGRPARRLRSASVRFLIGGLTVLLAIACGDAPEPSPEPTPEEKKPSRARELRHRFLEIDWVDVGEYETVDLVKALRGYIDSQDPVWPNDDRHYEVLTNFLIRTRPVPSDLAPLLGEHRGEQTVDMHLLKRDKIARAVVHSMMGRIWKATQEGGVEDDVAALWDTIIATGIHFSFEAVYEASHPGTAESLSEFCSDPNIHPSEESRRAFEKYAPDLIGRWRKRVTRKATSMFFGNMLRHLGPSAAELLYAEWEGMDGNERYDLLRRTALVEPLGTVSRTTAVNAMLDESYDVREAAVDLLRRLEAPLGELDGSSSDEDIEKALPKLRDWAAKTDS